MYSNQSNRRIVETRTKRKIKRIAEYEMPIFNNIAIYDVSDPATLDHTSAKVSQLLPFSEDKIDRLVKRFENLYNTNTRSIIINRTRPKHKRNAIIWDIPVLIFQLSGTRIPGNSFFSQISSKESDFSCCKSFLSTQWVCEIKTTSIMKVNITW